MSTPSNPPDDVDPLLKDVLSACNRLAEHVPDADERDRLGLSALMYAAQNAQSLVAATRDPNAPPPSVLCSLCGRKGDNELISGGGGAICSGCIELSAAALEELSRDTLVGSEPPDDDGPTSSVRPSVMPPPRSE